MRKALFENPLFIDRIISKDGEDHGHLCPAGKGRQRKGDRRQNHGRSSGKRRATSNTMSPAIPWRGTPSAPRCSSSWRFSRPIAGMVMLARQRYLMFRDLFLSITLMMDAMISIVWSMGLLIGLGLPHPYHELHGPRVPDGDRNRQHAHLQRVLLPLPGEARTRRPRSSRPCRRSSRPVRNTALATAAGFAVLLFMNIIPVRVFGGLVAFGTIALRILSFSFIPAMFTFVKEEKIEKSITRAKTSPPAGPPGSSRSLPALGTRHPGKTVAGRASCSWSPPWSA